MDIDPRLEITDPPRILSGAARDMPLVTIAWRGLRAEQQRRAAERRLRDEADDKVDAAIVAVADQAFRLRRAADGPGGAGNAFAAVMATAAARLDAALAELGARVLAPVGAPYLGELCSLLESAAQSVGDGAEPRVAEVLLPAVLRGERLLRGGKVVVATPAPPPDAAV